MATLTAIDGNSLYGINLTVTSENPTYSVQVGQHPVEDLGTIVDNVKQDPIEIGISGVVVGTDAGQKIAKLIRYNRNGNLLKYVGRNVLSDCIIESLNTTHTTQVSNGFEFDIKLLSIRRAKTQYVTLYGRDPITLSQYTQTQVSENKSKIYTTLLEKAVDDETLNNIRSKVV